MTDERNAERKSRLRDLVRIFDDNFSQYQRTTYNETEVRVDFVNPFFQILGWDIINEAGLPQHLREVVHEATVSVEEDGCQRSKKPDYSFKIGAETQFFLETKKPSVNLTADRLPAFQLRRYGWSGNLRISVLTNFTDLYIYDCSIRPISGDDIGTALVAHYHYSEYVDKFEEIFLMLSKETVVTGEFKRKFNNISGAFRREPFDSYFLDQIRTWRNDLGKNVISNNLQIDNDTLNIFVQRLLNRVIFLRICEDRNLEKYESLRVVSTYTALRQLFVEADNKYDSGLFELLDEDGLVVSDDVIITIFQSLYYPNNSYEFGVVDPYIIGQIYEMFLDEALVALADGSINAERKPEVVDAQGVVNTPKNITDIIVAETLNPLYGDKALVDIVQYNIVDICCGAGNFLLSAFEYVINYYIEFFLQYDYEGAIQRGDLYGLPGTDRYQLSYAKKREILENNIFGVDIDPLAIEVTKLSLLLKVIEGTTAAEIQAYQAHFNKKVLPNLDSNIKNGNSLVSSDYAKFCGGILTDIELSNKVKMFDFSLEFSGKEFHAIVGNPPYIRVQNMVHYSKEEYEYYKSSQSPFVTTKANTLDKYYIFIEQALMLLADNGVMGYIVPHKFMCIQSGCELRTLLSDSSRVKKIIHFGTHQIFENRSTYTCILILSKQANTTFEIGYVNEMGSFLSERKLSVRTYSSKYLTGQPWVFLSQSVTDRLQSLEPRCTNLSEMVDIFVGAQTSADYIYIVHPSREDNNYVYVTDKNQKKWKIERGILRKSIYDAQLSKYEKIEANSYIIFPYKQEGSSVILYSLVEMEKQFPQALLYLKQARELLDRRSMPNRGNDNWFAFGRNQSISRFMGGEHLIWPVLSKAANYVFDNENILFTGGGNGPFYGLEMKRDTSESIFYLQAILNHPLMEMLVKSRASQFRDDYYSHGKQFLVELPIYRIDFENPSEVLHHDEIVEKVRMIMSLKESLKSAPNNVRKNMLNRSIETLDNDIKKLIDELYQIEM